MIQMIILRVKMSRKERVKFCRVLFEIEYKKLYITVINEIFKI